MLLQPAAAGLVGAGGWREHERGDGGVLPVLPPLREVLPGGGLRRGTTVAVSLVQDAGRRAPAAMSLLLALLAGPSGAGSWCAVVGVEGFGAVAACEAGIDLARLALVPVVGDDWVKVVAALVDGFDVVAIAPPARAAAVDQRRLAARARTRGAVLLSLGQWPGAEVRLTTSRPGWEGLGQGHGRLRARRLEVHTGGRGAAARPRPATVWLPARDAPVAPFAALRSGLPSLPGDTWPVGDLPGGSAEELVADEAG